MYPQNYMRDHRWEDEAEENRTAPDNLQEPDLWNQPTETERTIKECVQKVNNSPSDLEDMETWG